MALAFYENEIPLTADLKKRFPHISIYHSALRESRIWSYCDIIKDTCPKSLAGISASGDPEMITEICGNGENGGCANCYDARRVQES